VLRRWPVLACLLASCTLACAATESGPGSPTRQPTNAEDPSPATNPTRLPDAPDQLGFGPSADNPVEVQVAQFDRLLALRGLKPLRSEPIAATRELRIWVRVFDTDLLVRVAETARGVEGERVYFAPTWIADAVADGACVVPMPPLRERAPIHSCASPRETDYRALLDQLEAHRVWSLPLHTPPRPNRTHPTWILVEAREGQRYRAWASHAAGEFDEAADIAGILDAVMVLWEVDGQLGG
jgi:hypothetical protein